MTLLMLILIIGFILFYLDSGRILPIYKYTCPGSKTWLLHNWYQYTVSTKTTCEAVKKEIIARANSKNYWSKYLLMESEGDHVTLQNGEDLIIIEMKQTQGLCIILSCSERQRKSESLVDDRKSFCNIWNLICNEKDKCGKVFEDWMYEEKESRGSFSSNAMKTMCIQGDYRCPSTRSLFHGYSRYTISTNTSCDIIKREIVARASHQNNWKDPQLGTYFITKEGRYSLDLEHISAMEKKKDAINMDFRDVDGRCFVLSCSKSDYISIFDGDSDFCNLWNLVCNTGDGCTKVKYDLAYTEEDVYGFGVDKKQCLNNPDGLNFF